MTSSSPRDAAGPDFAGVLAAHNTSVRYSRQWDEYVADCSCGWTGSYLPTESAAENSARVHVSHEVEYAKGRVQP